MRAAVFLDRDGTINEESGHIADPARMRLLPGAAQAVKMLNRRGIPTILVTNQAGPARGLYAEETVLAVLAEMRRLLAREGAHLDAVYYCPHLPEAPVPAYACSCSCRKPEPGLLLQAAGEHALDLRRSFMIGDQPSDIEAGARAGCRTILVLTGHGARFWAERSLWRAPMPDHVAEDLPAAVAWILDRAPRLG
ncbi:MAG: D-glycero-alpha-D-manno-heptose-1,7-bisphosphate 7-phosphatase [Bacteroidota bacterium]